MLDHGNWRETVKFQLSVYACLSSVLSTAEGLDATALKLTVSIPGTPGNCGNGFTKMG